MRGFRPILVCFVFIACGFVVALCDGHKQGSRLTVCELFQDLRAYRGKLATLVGTYQDTYGHFGIGHEECPGRCVIDGIAWPTVVLLLDSADTPQGERPVQFKTEPGSFEQIARGVATSSKGRERPRVWITVTGVVRAKKRYHKVQTKYGSLGTGYGHLGAFPVVLVVKRVDEVVLRQTIQP